MRRNSSSRSLLFMLIIIPFVCALILISNILNANDVNFGASSSEHDSSSDAFCSSDLICVTSSPETSSHECFFEISISEPTCTSEGIRYYSCACGNFYSEVYAGKAEHCYNLNNQVDPTCVNEGYIEYLCTCGDYFHESLDILPHCYTQTIFPATCTSEGYTSYICVCGDAYTEVFSDKTEHSYKLNSITAATCTDEGFIEYLCTCGDYYIERIDIVAHKYTKSVTPPTCTSGGLIEYLCTCGDYYTESIDTVAHKYTESVFPATCTSEGTVCYTCVCGDSYSFEIKATGHKYSAVKTAPSCVSEGYTTYSCPCGDTYTDNYTKAISHKWSDWVISSEATTVKTGTKYRTCSYCKEVKTEIISVKASVNLDEISPVSMFNGVSSNALKAIEAVLQCVEVYYGTGRTDQLYLGKFELTWIDVSMAESALAFYFGSYYDGLKSTTFYYEDDEHYHLFVNLSILCEVEAERRIMMSAIMDVLSRFEAGSREHFIEQVFNYLSEHIRYDSQQPDASVAIKTGKGSCNAYPVLFKIMLCMLGVDSEICVGYSYTGGYHAWNRIQLADGAYRYYDLTFYISTGSSKYMGSSSLRHDLVAVNRYLTANDPH